MKQKKFQKLELSSRRSSHQGRGRHRGLVKDPSYGQARGLYSIIKISAVIFDMVASSLGRLTLFSGGKGQASDNDMRHVSEECVVNVGASYLGMAQFVWHVVS